MKTYWVPLYLCLMAQVVKPGANQRISNTNSVYISGISIQCHSNNIQVTIATGTNFNGMVYPKGLSKNSTCMVEYSTTGGQVIYTLPLHSCNTMNTDVRDGVEYFNTVVVQPHRKLVTSQGRGYHVRCRYQTKEKTILSNFNVSMLGTTPMYATAAMPTCHMKIFQGDPDHAFVAENVKIGDQLTLLINIDVQDIYGMKVTNCLVRDGLNWGEQPLINNNGCPVDLEVMGPFDYTLNKTRAIVTFKAHKFPYTSSVYYQCNVKLCLKQSGGCDDVPPKCDVSGNNLLKRRRKRESDLEEKGDLEDLKQEEQNVRDLSIEVYSGLYVNEVDNLEKSDDTRVATQLSVAEDEFCVSTRKFAIGIAVAGVSLMLAVVLLVACILHRRRRRKGIHTAGSSIYSGPYSNAGYSRE
ncbi:cuticlin-1-like [Tachypleus tridentatus]|uniref:cuticlin-1-like n=1 Tax=Tachypleus tridentatus TaxID=6853 RepID=UPI003FD130BB